MKFRPILDFVYLRQAYMANQRLPKSPSLFRTSLFKGHLNFNLFCKGQGLILKSLCMLRLVHMAFGHLVVSKAKWQLLKT